jgi:hypothetical protein
VCTCACACMCDMALWGHVRVSERVCHAMKQRFKQRNYAGSETHSLHFAREGGPKKDVFQMSPACGSPDLLDSS